MGRLGGETGVAADLATAIQEALLPLGFKPDKPFSPHMTIARVREGNAISRLAPLSRVLSLTGTVLPEQASFQVTGVSLMQSFMQSGGSVYKQLAPRRRSTLHQRGGRLVAPSSPGRYAITPTVVCDDLVVQRQEPEAPELKWWSVRAPLCHLRRRGWSPLWARTLPAGYLVRLVERGSSRGRRTCAPRN